MYLSQYATELNQKKTWKKFQRSCSQCRKDFKVIIKRFNSKGWILMNLTYEEECLSKQIFLRNCSIN